MVEVLAVHIRFDHMLPNIAHKQTVQINFPMKKNNLLKYGWNLEPLNCLAQKL